MRTVSSRFLESLVRPHQPVSTVYVDETPVPIVDGSVTLDGQSTTRGSVTLTVAVNDDNKDLWIPDSPYSLLAPYGNEVEVARGIQWADGSPPEMVNLGKFRIDDTNVDDRGRDLTVEVVGLDRSAIIIDGVFERGDVIPVDSVAAEVIQELVNEVYDPTYASDFLANEVTLPFLMYEIGEDRWDFCQGLAQAIYGSALYFDGDGVLTLAKPKTTLTEPDYTITEGDQGNLLGASKAWGREDACNRVVVTGESSGETPVMGVAMDLETGSPTHYYSSDFGRVTFSYSSEYIRDQEQADDVAQTILNQKLGTGQQISFEAFVCPMLEPGDVVEVVRERIGVNELHVIDSVTIPLTKDGTMTATTRVTRVTG